MIFNAQCVCVSVSLLVFLCGANMLACERIRVHFGVYKCMHFSVSLTSSAAPAGAWVPHKHRHIQVYLHTCLSVVHFHFVLLISYLTNCICMLVWRHAWKFARVCVCVCVLETQFWMVTSIKLKVFENICMHHISV